MFTRINVVIESVFDCRTDSEFHAGIKFLKSLGKQVGRTVPESMLSFRIIPFEKLDFSIFLNGTCQVPFLAVNCGGKNILRETRTDTLCDLQRSGSAFKLFYRFIGKCNIYH